MNRVVRFLIIICRVIIGLVFIFSGFVKGVDPMGSAIKFSEYFDAFHLPWLQSFGLVLAVLLSSAEFLIGIALLTGLRMKVTSLAAFLFMCFFTLITLYSAIWSPVSDCGCFGDALVITNWQTFYKNLVLITLAFIVFFNRKSYKPFAIPLIEWSLVIFFACFAVGVSLYSLEHLPLLNFRPYSIGTHIPSKMIMPEGVQGDVYQTTLYYEKNHEVKAFTLQNFPWKDSTWKFKDQKSVLVKRGYSPPIHGFSISSATNEEIAPRLLQDTSYSFIFISYDLRDVKSEQWQKIKQYYQFLNGTEKKFYLVTSSTEDVWENLRLKYNLPFDIYYADPVTLKTIMRANPGLMLLKGGIILGLWNYNDLPEASNFKENILSNVLTGYQSSLEGKSILFLGFILVTIFLLMLLYKKQLQ